MVRNPNMVPPTAWLLLAVSVALFTYSWAVIHYRDSKWKRHAKAVEPEVMNRQMLERLRQSGIERMARS